MRRNKKAVMTEEIHSETSGEDCASAGCIFCNDLFSSFKQGKSWIKCPKCYGWIHETYAGIGEQGDGEEEYVC
jgi:hypothetical protein